VRRGGGKEKSDPVQLWHGAEEKKKERI